MELEKIRNLDAGEIKAQAARAGDQLFRIRFQKTLGNVEGLKKLRSLKLDLARFKTVERERQLSNQSVIGPAQGSSAPLASTRTARKQEKKA